MRGNLREYTIFFYWNFVKFWQQFDAELTAKLDKVTPKADKRCRGNSWFVPYDTIANREKHRGSHPATYPVSLIENCIKFSGLSQGILVDPFMGSGTTGKACGFEGYNFVGIERDSDYFEIAKARIEHAYKQETVNLEKFFEWWVLYRKRLGQVASSGHAAWLQSKEAYCSTR